MSESERETRTSRKRAAILEAATAAFRDEGYETTSMDRIAELASVSKRTVYNHFGSKEALFQAVVDRLFDRAAALKRVPWNPELSLEEQLTAVREAAASADPADLEAAPSLVAPPPEELLSNKDYFWDWEGD